MVNTKHMHNIRVALTLVLAGFNSEVLRILHLQRGSFLFPFA